MLELRYSKIVQQKLKELQIYLIQISGEKRGRQQMRELISSMENLMIFPEIGMPISLLYDVEPGFEKYQVLIRPKNYVIYYVENQTVFIAELYDYREDYANQFFRIVEHSEWSNDD
jgi:plasmid stabilization system protein ParE